MNKKDQERFLKAFGKNLIRLRKDRKLSQAQLAADADIDLSTLSRIERGILNISVWKATKIAACLEVHHRELFNFDFPLSGK